MQCPFCQEEVGSADDLQIHCLVCTSAYAGTVCKKFNVFNGDSIMKDTFKHH